MRFDWKNYAPEYEEVLEQWCKDENTQKYASHSLKDDYQYYSTCKDYKLNKTFFFKVISEETVPVAALLLCGSYGYPLVINAFVVAPEKRNLGYGKAILQELIDNVRTLLPERYTAIDAGTEQENISCVQALEKTSFTKYKTHPNGLFSIYRYVFPGEPPKPPQEAIPKPVQQPKPQQSEGGQRPQNGQQPRQNGQQSRQNGQGGRNNAQSGQNPRNGNGQGGKTGNYQNRPQGQRPAQQGAGNPAGKQPQGGQRPQHQNQNRNQNRRPQQPRPNNNGNREGSPNSSSKQNDATLKNNNNIAGKKENERQN